jgi:hypothetical protein
VSPVHGHLVQILLPLADNDGRPFARTVFEAVKVELAERFGGVTAFTQSPAEGLWQEEADRAAVDRVVIFEAMTQALDEAWWAGYRRDLERRFRQDAIVIRALPMRRM